MIDLSFLTEEEQETILAVLKRDASLKKAEEKRVKNLQRSASNKGRLKYLTGEWFYETKSLRHRDRIHGSDLIRASMRHTHKPLTILERSQMLPERPSFVSSDYQEVSVPPQLSGLIQVPHIQISNESGNQNWNPFVKPQEIPVLQSPTKQRQNPFNSKPLAPLEENQLVDGPVEQTLTPGGDFCEHYDAELLSPQVSNPFSAEQPGKPVHVETEREEDGLSKAKATDWLTGHSIHQPQPKLPEKTGDNLDIFVEATSDTKPSSNDNSKNSSYAVSPKPRKGLLGIFSRGEAKEKTAELQSPHKEEVKLSKQKELDDNLNHHSSQSAANITKDNQINFASVKQEAKSPGTTEFRMLQVTALQNNPFIETMTSLGSDLDTQQEPTEGEDRGKDFPRRLSNLKAFWERGNSDPKVIFTREQAEHEDSPKTKTEDLHDPQNVLINSTLESKTDNFSTQMELTEECRTKDNVAQSHEEIPSPQIESNILLDLPEEDGTYRANPILISEETDDSLTGSITDSQIPEPQENITAPLPISLSCNIPQQKGKRPVPLPRGTDHRPTVINEEYSIVGRVMEDSGSPMHSSSSSGQTMHHKNKVVSSHSDLRTSLSSREKSEEEVQNSSHSTKSNVVSNTKHVTDKGFVSHSSDKSQLRSSGIPGNVSSTYQQYQLKTEIESVLPQERPLSPSRAQTRPLSPSRAQTPRSKDSTDDEVGRSPSKTCHPKALPREPSSPKGSSLEGSPLKTFPIDIAPPTKAHEEQSGRPTPAARQRKSPSHEAQLSGLMDIKLSTEIITRSLILQPEDGEQHHLTLSPSVDPVQSLTHSARRSKFGNVNTQQSSQSSSTGLQSRKTSESANIGPALTKRDLDDQLPGSSKNLGTVTPLARCVIPRDYQHYLGAPEKSHLPPFHQEKVGEESNVKSLAPSPVPVAVHRPQSPLTELEGNQGNSTIEKNHSRIRIVQNTDNSSQDGTTGAWSQSRASSGSYDDDSSPLRSALKRISSRSMSSSKSLEILTSQTREERSKNNPRGQLNLTVDDASSLLDSEQMKKMSVSVPVFQQEEMDSDSASENMSCRRNTGSSMSNISLSSGMASMSSVSGSVSSLYFGDTEVQGTIQFAVNYIQKLGEFHIFVVHCRDLAVAEPKKNYSDPYVKCYLLPDQTKLGKRKTSVKKKTLNPTYNEILRFKIIMEVLKTQKLNISVWHNDTFGRNSFLGEVNLDLSEWDFSNTQINDFALKARVPAPISASSPSHSVDTRGQMRVALRFLPQLTHSKTTSKTGEVQIWVKDCKNLPPVRGVIIDPFVKCSVLPDTSRRSRQKTRVVKRTANPMFNHTMVYDGFRPEDLREACVEITVWDHDRLNNHYIGGLRLGLGTGKSYGAEVAWMDSTTDEANLWKRMMQSHGEWVEDVLPLRMLMMAKCMSK